MWGTIEWLKEFKWFIVKGSAADMGIGLVLGAAFGGLIDSLVRDILLPPVGLLLTKVNMNNLYISLSGSRYASLAEAQAAGAVTVNYGLFITSFIRFFIVLFAVFIVIRQMNRWRKPNEDPFASMKKKECPLCRMNIPSQAIKCPYCNSSLEMKETESLRKTETNELLIKIK